MLCTVKRQQHWQQRHLAEVCDAGQRPQQWPRTPGETRFLRLPHLAEACIPGSTFRSAHCMPPCVLVGTEAGRLSKKVHRQLAQLDGSPTPQFHGPGPLHLFAKSSRPEILAQRQCTAGNLPAVCSASPPLCMTGRYRGPAAIDLCSKHESCGGTGNPESCRQQGRRRSSNFRTDLSATPLVCER